MHLDQERVQRLLHEELSPAEAATARAHCATCEACRGAFELAEQEEHAVLKLLRSVDHQPPAITAGALIARSDRGRVAQWRWAAGALLALSVAGVAWALPGSPVRGWLGGVGRPRAAPTTPTLSVPDPVAKAPEPSSGIAIAPGTGLRIEFTSTAREVEALVTLTDDAEVMVSAPTGRATFTTAPDRLLVASDGRATTFEIRIPRFAVRVEILVDGERRFLKQGPRLSPASSTGGEVRIDLAPPPPRL